MRLTFKKLNRVKKLFCQVEELVLNNNQCNDFENITMTDEEFPNLTSLDLTLNDISSLEEMKHWKLTNLKKLSLRKNYLEDI